MITNYWKKNEAKLRKFRAFKCRIVKTERLNNKAVKSPRPSIKTLSITRSKHVFYL